MIRVTSNVVKAIEFHFTGSTNAGLRDALISAACAHEAGEYVPGMTLAQAVGVVGGKVALTADGKAKLAAVVAIAQS